MKYAVILAATAALALSACKKTEDAAPAAAEASASAAPSEPAAAAGAATPAAFTAGEAPSKEFMAGIWGEGDACTLPLNFQADGTIKDGPFPKWNLENGELTMEGAPQKLKLKVVDEKTMESSMDGSKPVILKRC